MAGQNDLTISIIEALEDYSDEVQDILEEEIENIADEGVEQLRATSPKRTGKYAKSWKKKKVDKGYIIYNSVSGLTHILEKGHAKRNGGRVVGIPHIAPVEEMISKKLEDSVSKRVSK